MLLLARPLGTWWDALTYRLAEALGVHADSVELTTLDTARISPREVFEVARSCFARALGVTGADHAAPVLDGSILTVHMAALAHVLAVRHGETPPTDPAQLSAYLLSRERNHWQSMYDNERRIGSTPEEMGRTVYVAALTRSLDYALAVPVLTSLHVADGPKDAGRMLGDHAMCYPPHDPDTVLEPLYPDRLAEDFVALQTPGHAIGGFRPDPWAKSALAVVVTLDERSAGTALTLVLEAARRWPHLASDQLVPLLRRQPELAILAGTAALSALAAAEAVPLDVLVAVESAFPAEPPADLHAGIAAITERLAADLSGHTDDPVRAAALALKLGWRLLDSGRIADGIALLTDAVDIARRLAGDDHRTHAAQLELALRSAGRAHVRARNWAPAVEALGEAVGLWTDERAPRTPPAEDVVTCLADLSLALGHQGRGTPSLSIRHRAIAQLRRLVAVDGRHRLTLIRVLVQQAEQLRRGNRHVYALEALDEAVALVKAVAENADSGFELDFAAALLGRAKTLQSLGRLDDATSAASVAVAVYRRLARANVRYDRDLAQARQAEAEVMAAGRRWPAALEAQAETVAIHRRLARISADRNELDLIHALIKLAALRRDARTQTDDALGALDEAIDLAQAPRHARGRDRVVHAANSIGADLLDARGRTAEAAARRRNLRPAVPPQPAPPSSPASSDLTREARTILNMPPYQARILLERRSAREIAALIFAMNPPYEWFSLMFRGFRPVKQVAVLKWLVRNDTLLEYRTLQQFILRQLVAADPDTHAEVLGRATIQVAAILIANVPSSKAFELFKRVNTEHDEIIVRLHGHPPGYPT